MIPIATIYIPYAPYHKSIVEKAFRSAANQTIKCEIVMEASTGTPSLLRNRAINAKTDFCVFLDADDTLEPTFVEECLLAYQQGCYVYTSWWCGQSLQKPNLCLNEGDKDSDYHSHLVTTLYPTALFKISGGFDETLKGHEDVDFYLRSAMYGICGIHLDKPLVHYTEHGQRSAFFSADAVDMKNTMDWIYLKNGGQRTIMGCCGGKGAQAVQNPGEAKPGDVQAQALWAGMHTEYSIHTGRLYTGGNNGILNVAPEDVEKMTDRTGRPMFKEVVDLTKLAPKRDKVLKDSGLI